jgi:triosephosphate isomerase
MPRRPFIAANWKMNPPPAGAFDTGTAFASSEKTEVVVFPSPIDLRSAVQCDASATPAAFIASNETSAQIHVSQPSSVVYIKTEM